MVSGLTGLQLACPVAMAADHLGEGEKEEEEGGIGHKGHAPKEQTIDTAVRDCPKIYQLKCSPLQLTQSGRRVWKQH